jgi:CRP/FNR family transcriptional regulator, anaerobic regulatory protein
MGERMNGTATATCTVDMPMTRSDIAGFLGLSLETVSRAAADLERRGLVKFETRHFVRIIDPAGLARLVAAI